MRKGIFAVVWLSAWLLSAQAMANDWTGLYLGLGLGERSTIVDSSVASAVETFQPAAGFPPLDLFTVAPCPCANGQSLDKNSFRVAPYLGFNWQFAPQWVTGIEGDWGWATGKRTVSGMIYPAPVFQNIGTYSVKSTWDASIRARLGYLPTPSVLVYATGGAAWLHIEQTSDCPSNTVASNCQTVVPTGTFGPPSITDSTTRLGWTIGGGLEAMLWSHWIVRAEYRYTDFGTWSPTDVRTCAPPSAGACFATGAAAITVTDDVRVRTHAAMIGLAYKFGGP